MIGINKTESSFFELGQIYSEIHDWIDSVVGLNGTTELIMNTVIKT